jgi:hypothetical protein
MIDFGLLRTLRIPAKRRLLATLKECERVVAALPDPVCEALEASGIVSSWRSQLETLGGVGQRVMSAAEVLRAAHSAVTRLQHARGR